MAAPVRRTATGLSEFETFVDAPEEQTEQSFGSAQPLEQSISSSTTSQQPSLAVRQQLYRSGTSYNSIPPAGSVLTGKQEHYLKRELVSHQSKWEVSELASPTALQRFGAPFRSDKGEVKPEDSELPLLRYVFNHHVRTFPFLDKAKEKEFWQDKLQVFLESFANKNISTSDDRLETTKRRKLAEKAEKLIELMMVSGIPTASGYEERIRFSEMEVVDRGAQEQGLVANAPQGHEINGWDVNVAGVRAIQVKKHFRTHTHAEYLIRSKQADKPEVYVGRKYDDFRDMHKRLRLELPGKLLPPLPKRNPTDSTYQSSAYDDSDSASSTSTREVSVSEDPTPPPGNGGLRAWMPGWGGGGGSGTSTPSGSHHKRHASNVSTNSLRSPRLGSRSPRPSSDSFSRPVTLFRESQRVSLRASLRNMLQNEQIARSNAMIEFLTADPIKLTDEELQDTERRKEVDERRIEEQKQFYDIARQRAAELDIHMEKFRRDIVESNGLTKLFQEIRVKKTIAELKPEYQKFAEWVRIEVAATIYHLFLAEDNSPELFAQGKRIHSLVPYTVLKNIVRFTNPAAVMAQVLDLFMAQPFGARSLLQRIFGMAIHDGINNIQKSIDVLSTQKIKDPVLCDKIKAYITASEEVKTHVKQASIDRQEDIVLTILQSDEFGQPLKPQQIESITGGYSAWERIVEKVPSASKSREALQRANTSTSIRSTTDPETRKGAEMFAHLKQLFKLYLRQRDKAMMLEVIEEPTTLKLFRDLFQIFYEPLVRVYKSANVYSSITDFSYFADDAIKVIEAAQRQDISADPNQTVQAFIDLCARHEDNLYKFIHEVHIHDNGLFSSLMHWVEGILDFLRHGPKGGKLDMNALFKASVEDGTVQAEPAMREINSLIKWQMARKRWHSDKTRQKMAAEGHGGKDESLPGFSAFRSSDFGINEQDLSEMDLGPDGSNSDEEDFEEEEEDLDTGADPIEAERKRREKERIRLRRSAGEPVKPEVVELDKMVPGFLDMLRAVLAE